MWYSPKEKKKEKLYIEQSAAKIWSQNAERLTTQQRLYFRSMDLKEEEG